MRDKSNCYLMLGVCALVCSVAGCQDLWPNFAHPGPAPYQRRQAEITDPYPEPDTGPEMVGARPRDYQKPAPEVERARRVDARFVRPTAAVPPQQF